MTSARWSVIVPSLCRPSLGRLLGSLARAGEHTAARPADVVVVDDRPSLVENDALDGVAGLPASADAGEWRSSWLADRLVVVRSGGRGPAAARNAGRRAVSDQLEWLVFLDDDVEVTASWMSDLAADLDDAVSDVVAVQGRITVPLPAHRPPNDAERNTAGLETAAWITADMAVRTSCFDAVGGFDERFPRAFREDADLALRLQAVGGRMAVGRRRTVHPARAGNWALSVRQQRGNADDVLMTRLHGRGWYERAQAPRGRRVAHLATVAAGFAAVAAACIRRPRVAAIAATGWAGLTGAFAWARIAPGPRDRAEITRMVATSVLIPPAAVWHWLRALVRVPRRPPAWPTTEAAARSSTPVPAPAQAFDALLVDRDGTIVVDVPYNGDPALVQPVAGVAEALAKARSAGLRIGVVSNQSGIARGLLDEADVAAVNARVEELLGPFDTWQICPHAETDGCACRKPQPGLVIAAAREIGVPVERCVVIGDIGSDMAAAVAAGAQAVLVPTTATLEREIHDAPAVAVDFAAAVDAVLAGRLPGPRGGRTGMAA